MIFLIIAFTLGITYVTVAEKPAPSKEHKVNGNNADKLK